MKTDQYFRMHLLLLIAGSGLFFSQAYAQGTRGGFGRFELGPSFLALNEVNQALIDDEYNPLSSALFALGGSWDGIHGRWIYGGKLYGFMVSQSELLNQVAILEYYYAQLHTGVVVYSDAQRWKVYPTAGIGWGTANLKLKPWSRQRPVPHLTSGAMMDFALNARHYLAFDTENENDYLLELGFSAGYLYAFEGRKMWQLGDFVPDRSLTLNPQGIYFRVSIGMGRLR